MRKVGRENLQGGLTTRSGSLRPVEIQYIFAVRDSSDESHTFSVSVDLLHGVLDLGVSFTDNDAELSLLPEELFEHVQRALTLVREKAKPGDLVERDD